MSKDYTKYRMRTRKDGIFEIAWNDPKTGKVRRESCKTRDEHVARRKLAEKTLTGDTVPPTVVTIGYILNRYFAYLKRRKREGTIGPMISKVERLQDYFGPLKWADFSQENVENYIDHARTMTRWDRGEKVLSDGTIKKDLQILRAALRHSHAYKTVPTETRIEINNLTSETRKDWLDEAMMLRVFAQCELNPDREHIYAFLLVALATGARKGAIFELTWDQVYIPKTEAKFVETAPVPVEHDGIISIPKKSYKRVVTKNMPLDWKTDAVVERAYIDFGDARGTKRRPRIPIAQNARLMMYLVNGGDRSQPYVVSFRGGQIKDGIKKGLEAVGKEANLPFKLTHHVMKRTCITWLVRGGIPFDTIEILTNTTVATLKKNYSQHDPDLAAALGDTFSI